MPPAAPDIRWSDIATSNDRIMHPLAQFPRIACVADQDDLVPCEGQIWAEPPKIGTLPRTWRRACWEFSDLLRVIRHAGSLSGLGSRMSKPPRTAFNALSVPARRYALYTGQLSDAATSPRARTVSSLRACVAHDRS